MTRAGGIAVTWVLLLVAAFTPTLGVGDTNPLKIVTNPHGIDPKEMAQINGKQYYFHDRSSTADWSTLYAFCQSLGMTMVGFETNEEFDAVVEYMYQNTTLLGWAVWTSGRFVEGTTYIWDNSGVTFDRTDPRFCYLENGEPGDAVMVMVSQRCLTIYPDRFAEGIMCEGL